MIYLHKILPILLLPTGLIILSLVAGLVLRKRSFTLAALVILTFSSTPLFSNLIVQSIEDSQQRSKGVNASKVDAIVVLSGGRVLAPGPDAISEWGDADRFWGGIELMKAQKAPLLIFTGGWVPWEGKAEPEGEVLRRYALELGIPKHQLAVTPLAQNTAQEAKVVAQLLRGQRMDSMSKLEPPVKDINAQPAILLVTSAFHMPRAQALFEKQGLTVRPFPVDFKVSVAKELSILDFLPSADAFQKTELAMREWYGRLYYRWVSP